MKAVNKYYPFFASALLMWVVLLIIYPHYQYYIDPDGTSYLTIARRYATGDIQRAVNGYWSPWACWLTAGLMRLGMQAIAASVVINALGATGFLFISHSFFLKFDIAGKMQWLLNVTLAFFLCYAIFWQSFDDLWECFFLLGTLRLMLAEGFTHRPALWLLCGFVGTLAYFAKAYSFPFFMLNTGCCVYFLCKGNKGQWLKISLVTIGVMVLCSLPWIWVLHNKYGIWTTSTSGTLNMSWYLVGHPHWKAGTDVLIRPTFTDSPYYWEDPWFANGDTPHFWDSISLFGREIVRIGYHVVLFLFSLLALSVFFPLIGTAAAVSVLKKRSDLFTGEIKMVALSFVLFPLGYLLVNFESRYLWYMLPLGMLLGAGFISSGKYRFRLPVRLLEVLFALSFLIVPAGCLVLMYNQGREEHQLAGQLKAAHIHGTFTGNIHPRFMSRLAYFSGNSYFFLLNSGGRSHVDGLMEDMQRNKVDYYLHYSKVNSAVQIEEKELFSDDSLLQKYGAQLTGIKVNGVNDVRVFKVAQ